MLLRLLSRTARPYLNAYGLLHVAKVFNRSALVWEPGDERVLVLAPHMDDEVIGCGGTLARHRQRGAEVSVIFLTDGRHGGMIDDAERARGQSLTSVRKQEAKLALSELGISRIEFLDAEDGRLTTIPELTARLRVLLLKLQPQIVYLPFFLEEHPDHRAVSPLLLAAAGGTSLNFRCHGYEVWTPLFPNCFVRIDDTVEAKRRALSRYRSQLLDADYLHTALGLSAYRSNAIMDPPCRYAEAFSATSLSQYARLYAAYAAQGSATGRPPA
jgi:LmbE family N-acetylglucosaminyl deacetylase